MKFPLIGSDRIRESVLAWVAMRRIPHAILIEGEKGTGRHTLAKYIANSCVCDGEDPPCGSCRGCHLAETGTHPDITVTAPEDGKKNITVAQIRNLRNDAYVKPHMASGRVFIIDKADTMNEQAQNALLKVLEEPPGEIVFILIAESKAALLDTVISRCTVLSLSVPETAEAVAYLKKNTEHAEEAIRNALDESGGNIGLTLEVLDGGAKSASAAEEFIAYMLASDEYNMLKLTCGFEKSRVEAGNFIKELKACTAEAVKSKHADIFTARVLTEFYNELPRFEQSLQTNINLSLLFCSLVCKAAEINKK